MYVNPVIYGIIMTLVVEIILVIALAAISDTKK